MDPRAPRLRGAFGSFCFHLFHQKKTTPPFAHCPSSARGEPGGAGMAGDLPRGIRLYPSANSSSIVHILDDGSIVVENNASAEQPPVGRSAGARGGSGGADVRPAAAASQAGAARAAGSGAWTAGGRDAEAARQQQRQQQREQQQRETSGHPHQGFASMSTGAAPRQSGGSWGAGGVGGVEVFKCTVKGCKVKRAKKGFAQTRSLITHVLSEHGGSALARPRIKG